VHFPGKIKSVLLPAAIVLVVSIFWIMAESSHAKGKQGGRAAASESLSRMEMQQAGAIYAKTCAGCHGARLEGVIGPSLVNAGSRYTPARIEEIAQRGKGSKKPVSMPAGLATAEEARLLARWLAVNPQFAVDASYGTILQ